MDQSEVSRLTSAGSAAKKANMPDISIVKTTMNAEQIEFMDYLASVMNPLQAEIYAINEEEQAAMRVVHEIRDRKRVVMAKLAPYAVIKPAVVSVPSRIKGFPEFYGKDIFNVTTRVMKHNDTSDNPEDITRFIGVAKELLAS